MAATAAAALALVLVPAAAATAYEADQFSSTVTDASVTPGEAIIYTVDGPVENGQITVTVTSNPTSIPNSAIAIAGTATLAKATDAAGNASFSITLSAAGTYTFTAVDAQGDVINTQAVTVAAAAAGAPAATLPVTGSSATPLAIGGGALAAAGIGAVLYSKKRRAALDA